jgi:hypothetical protein
MAAVCRGVAGARRCCGVCARDSGECVCILLQGFAERREERGVFTEGLAWATG